MYEGTFWIIYKLPSPPHCTHFKTASPDPLYKYLSINKTLARPRNQMKWKQATADTTGYSGSKRNQKSNCNLSVRLKKRTMEVVTGMGAVPVAPGHKSRFVRVGFTFYSISPTQLPGFSFRGVKALQQLTIVRRSGGLARLVSSRPLVGGMHSGKWSRRILDLDMSAVGFTKKKKNGDETSKRRRQTGRSRIRSI